MGEANDWNVGEALRANTGHVFSAVSFTAGQIETLTETQRLLAKRRGVKDPVEVEEHFILDTLDRPNDLYSGPEQNGLIAAWLQIAGFAAVAKARDAARRPIGLWPLLPDRTRLVAGTTRPIDGVNYYPDGMGSRAIGFPREDVVLFRSRSLDGNLYGFPNLRAAAVDKSISDKALRMRLAWFDNQARPDYVLAPKLPTGKDRQKEQARLWANLMIHHQGLDKYGLPLIVPEGTEIQTLSFTAEALQLVEQLNLTRDNLYEFFGVDSVLMGHYESIPARATLETSLARYGISMLEPMACRMWGTYQRDLIDVDVNPLQNAGTRLKLSRASAIPADKEFDLRKAIEGFKASLLDRNQSLALIGEPPIDGPEGEERAPIPGSTSFDLSSARISAGDAAAAAGKAAFDLPAPILEAIREIHATGTLVKETVDRLEKLALPAAPIDVRAVEPGATKELPDHLATDEKRAEAWAKAIKPQDKATRQATQVMRVFFRAQADRIIPELEAEVERLQGKCAGWSRGKVLLDFERRFRARGWAGPIERRMDHARRIADPAAWLAKMGKDDPGFDADRERGKLEDALRPLARNAVDAAGSAEAAQLRAAGLQFAWDIDSPAANRWLESHITQTASDITDTTAELLSAVARDGVAEGLSTQEIARSMRTVMASWSDQSADTDAVLPGYRAARIARTEISAAFGFGQDVVLQEADDEDLLDGSMWLTARDGHVRSGVTASGKVVGATHQIDGEVAAVGEQFSNGMLYPGDMSSGNPADFANDRCSRAAVVKRS